MNPLFDPTTSITSPHPTNEQNGNRSSLSGIFPSAMSVDSEYNYSDYDQEEEEEEVEEEEEDEDEEYTYSDDGGSDIETTNYTIQRSTKGTAAERLSPTAASKKKRLMKYNTTLSSKLRTTSQGAEYRVIDEMELQYEQTAQIQDIASVLNISLSMATILLRHFNWNKDKLYDSYYTNPNLTKENAGAQYTDKQAELKAPEDMMECNICCDTLPGNEVFAMGCKHYFCLDCWRSYLSVKIEDGNSCLATTCPSFECKEVVSDTIFKQWTTFPLYEKYKKYLLKSYVEINKCVKWCPAPGCKKAISTAGGLSSVQCDCGCVFCVRCGEEAHAPVTCAQLAEWEEKCKNESETANWIMANTKKCPKCSVRIEKNQGCNHMTCATCRYEFCWICMGDWKEHGTQTGGYYKCNRYETNAKSGEISDAERARVELDRYLHYYQRFANHNEAGKFAASMKAKTESRMAELTQSRGDSCWVDVQFLEAAITQLVETRRVLKYTYVVGYYLPNGKEKNLFEYLQEDLEKNAEHLTELIEAPLEKINRSEVTNYTRVTKQFLQNLLNGVEDGLTSDILSPGVQSVGATSLP